MAAYVTDVNYDKKAVIYLFYFFHASRIKG